MNSKGQQFFSCKQSTSTNFMRIRNTEKATKKQWSASLMITSQKHTLLPRGKKISNSINRLEHNRERWHQRKRQATKTSVAEVHHFSSSSLPHFKQNQEDIHDIQDQTQKSDTWKQHGTRANPKAAREACLSLIPAQISPLSMSFNSTTAWFCFPLLPHKKRGRKSK